jgi:membrane protein YdbS with pleckstrin-like domain
MLSAEEKAFVNYWEVNRVSKKRVLKQLYAGLPLAMILVVAIFANLFSGWYSRAQMVMSREASSLVIVLLVAALAIVVFIVIFSARHRWEQNELRYRELLHKAEKK